MQVRPYPSTVQRINPSVKTRSTKRSSCSVHEARPFVFMSLGKSRTRAFAGAWSSLKVAKEGRLNLRAPADRAGERGAGLMWGKRWGECDALRLIFPTFRAAASLRHGCEFLETSRRFSRI
jgi:hypothetical protein